MIFRLCLQVLCSFLILAVVSAEEEVLDGENGRQLALDQFSPKPQLVVPEHHPQQARFAAVDVHVHCRYKLKQIEEELDEFVRLMDQQNIAVCVSLDGGLGERLAEHKKFLWTKHKDRFAIFANIDWRGSGKEGEPETWDCLRPDFGHRMAQALADAKAQGASGLKIFKRLGLGLKDSQGYLLRVDDLRWDPIWETCGELELPVLIHVADPVAFFAPVDRFNERWEELHRHPEWSFSGEKFPTHKELLQQFLNVVERHPRTTFISAHMANYPENLEKLGEWLDRYPNLYVDIAARLAEIGRQPFSARKFFCRHSDRILFGTDGPRSVGRLNPHWRLLETADQYFPYAEDQYPPQGFWQIYGLDLPAEVLQNVYASNAERLIPGIRPRMEKWRRSHLEMPAAKSSPDVGPGPEVGP